MNKIKQILPFIFLIALVSQSTLIMAANERYAKQKVVYHINYDDAKKQSSTLRNIENHINAVGADNLEIRVVLHGDGLSLIIKPEALNDVPRFKHANANQAMAQKIDKLKLQGVNFNVCANTVKGRNVDTEKHLYDVSKEDIVPSGVAELAHLQSQGFTYLRP